MTYLFILTAYLIQAAVFLTEIRKGWILGAAIAGYAMICMAVFDYVVSNGLQNSDFIINYTSFTALPLNQLEPFANETRIVFTSISILVFLASLGGMPRVDRSGGVRSAFATIQQRYISRFEVPITAALLLMTLMNAIHFFSMDLETLWHNTSYLTIKTAEDMGLTNPIMAIYHEGLRILALLTIVGYFALSWREDPGKKMLFLLYSLYGLMMMLAGSSRWIGLYGLMAIVGMYAFGKLTPTRGIVVGMLTLLGFEYAIYSRSLNDFGLSRILPNLGSITFEFVYLSLGAIFVNAFEGALNFANGLKIAPLFTTQYQVLSLSPFPNVIDGYDRNDAVGINAYAPMGGLGEVYLFDWPFQLVFLTFMFTFLRLAYQADRRANVLLRYAVTFVGIYCTLVLASYSLRTTWKIFVFLTGLLIIWRMNLRGRQPTPSRRTAAVASPRAAGLGK